MSIPVTGIHSNSICTLLTRKRYSVGLADSAARVLLQVNDNTPVKLKIIFAI